MNEPDIPGHLTKLKQIPPQDRRPLPFVGFDENLNNDKIKSLGPTLAARGKIQMYGPLWLKTRVDQLDGSVLFVMHGGVSEYTRPPEGFSTLGADKRGEKTSDRGIVSYLTCWFAAFSNLVLLSSDTHRDKDGLWMVLNQEAKPNLPEGCSLTVIFKDGRTDLDSYCRRVLEFFDQHTFRPGYSEHVL
jgi:hypothetical protein